MYSLQIHCILYTIHCVHILASLSTLPGFCVCFAISRANWRYICVFGIIRGVVSAHARSHEIYIMYKVANSNRTACPHDTRRAFEHARLVYRFIVLFNRVAHCADWRTRPSCGTTKPRNYVCIHYVYEIEECSMCVYMPAHREPAHRRRHRDTQVYERFVCVPLFATSCNTHTRSLRSPP